METILPPKKTHTYSCELCNYFTSYSKDYKKHLLTKKHKSVTMKMEGNIKEIEKVLICQNCNKEFKTNAGLWKHNKKCVKTDDHIPNIIEKQEKIIQIMMKEMFEYKQMIIEQNKIMIDLANKVDETTNKNDKSI